MAAVKTGAQEPRLARVPKFEWSAGDDAMYLAECYGWGTDPWQAPIIVSWLGEDRRGKLTSSRCGIAVPRQNGKNRVVEIVELYKLVVQGRKILHTAHEVKTTRKSFLRMKAFFENPQKFPELAEMVLEIRSTNGQEAIFLTNGGSIEYIARSRGSGRGFTVDDLVCDEAQDLTDEQLEALLPTISSPPQGDPQQIYAGTPPGPRSPGEVFVRMRRACAKGKVKRTSWHEWSIPDDAKPEKVVEHWRDLAFETNPSLGIRLSLATVEDESTSMSPDGFCRERLGQWEPESDGAAAALNIEKWNKQAIKVADVPTDVRPVFAAVFKWDGSGVALAGAKKPTKGHVHVEAIKQAPMSDGTQWLVDWLAEHADDAAQIVVYGKGMAESLVNDLRDAGVKNRKLIWVPKFEQVVTAHAMLEEAVKTGRITHLGQSQLTDQVRVARKTPIGKGGGFGWTAPDDHDHLMLDAITFAYWAARTTRRRPGAKTRGGVR